MSDRDGGSLYDFAGDYEAPAQMDFPVKNTPAPVKPVESLPVETPHANRPHGQLKYENNLQFTQKADATPTNAPPKTSASYEWGLILASRDSSNHIALKINKGFTRANIGVNFQAEKARYLAAYKQELHENF